MALIAPSLLAADLARLGETLRQWQVAGATMVHVDVTDGHFLPDITVGQPVIQSLRKATDLILDIHLQVERAERYASQFAESGADRVAIPVGNAPNAYRVLGAIRAQGALAGLAADPSTAIDSLGDALEDADYLLLILTESGPAHSPFLRRSIQRVLAAAALRRERGLRYAIEVEGGIGLGQVEELREAGADILVPSSDIFENDAPLGRLGDMVRLAAAAGKSSRS